MALFFFDSPRLPGQYPKFASPAVQKNLKVHTLQLEPKQQSNQLPQALQLETWRPETKT